MTADEAVVAVLDGLAAAEVPYMIVGSLASNFHGIPRSTRDADVIIDLVPGARYLIKLTGNPFVCELFVRSDDAHDRERFARRQRVLVLGRDAFVATAEDMIVTKLRWARDAGRLKDREDIRNIVAVRGSELDWPYLERWTSEHGTGDLLAEIRASLPAS